MIGRILLTLTVLAVTGFVLLVFIGLWDRYERETAALGFRGIFDRYLASQAGFSGDPKTRAGDEAERARQGAVGREQLVPAQFFQRVPKLVGTGAVGITNQGMSVALSADGNTAIIGGPGPNNADRDRSPVVGPAGAAWVFTRRAGIWTQEGDKLVGTTSEYGGGLWSQGASVALSADGSTAVVGGPSDNRTTGAAWVFTYSGDGWTQQGKKLVGTGANRASEPPLSLGQGLSVALSADGNTAIIGGWRAEGVWVFTRSGGVWAQQGNKLVGSGAVGSARQGMAVALSADGYTAVVGGPGDNPPDRSRPFGLGPAGAAWVFARSGSVWTQQANKLVSSGAVGSARQGTSVALSADGNIAVVGGFAGDGSVGAVSVFTRSRGHWTQDKELAGIGAVGKSISSVALSADGSLVLIGGPNENGGVGAAWVFTRSGGGSDSQEPPTPSAPSNSPGTWTNN
jgi:hypothetical protein